MLQVLLQRKIGSSVSEPVPEFSEEQAIEADSDAYDDLRPLVSAGGTDWDGDLPAGLYVVGQDLPAGTYTKFMRICPPTTLRIRGWTTSRCPRVRCCS